MADTPQGQDGLIAAAERAKRKPSVAPRSFRGRIVAGILLIIPLAVTAMLMRVVYQAALSVGAGIVNYVYWASLWVMARYGHSPASFDASKPLVWIDPSNPTWLEVAMAIGLTILMLYILGWLGTNVVGRRFIEAAEALLERIPFVDTIYGAMKRMVHALSGRPGDANDRQRVVVIEFPNPNMKALALMTNEFTDSASGRRYATVFVPTTPNPTSGYMEIVPVEKILETDLTMEQALSMILSGGATAPPAIAMRQRSPEPEAPRT